MVNPIKIVNNITQVISKGANTVSEAVSESLPHSSEAVAETSGELLRAYHGIRPTKLFASFSDFNNNFMQKIEEFKGVVPENLYSKVLEAAKEGNFSFSKILEKHYSGLNECKTVKEAMEMYPEIKVFDTNFEAAIARDLKSVIPADLCSRVQSCATGEEKVKLMTEFFDKHLGKCLSKWGIYPEVKQIQNEVIQEVISGKYKGMAVPKEFSSVFTYKEPLHYKFMREPDRDKAILDILKDLYINGASVSNYVFKTADGREIRILGLKKYGRLSSPNRDFMSFIKNAEATAGEFAKLATMDKSEINSAIFTQTWRTSRLRADLGNVTQKGKDWSIVKAVWQKTMFPETTFYPTDKLIDTYLLSLFKSGKRTADVSNPILKYLDTKYIDKKKVMLLKRLYKDSRTLEQDDFILKSDAFKEFKAQFDIEGMTKSIEEIEEHYKNTFFKYFWTDDRKARFAKALNENREIAKANVEVSDKLLTDAMNNVFVEA